MGGAEVRRLKQLEEEAKLKRPRKSLTADQHRELVEYARSGYQVA
jgi:hypothetical protein